MTAPPERPSRSLFGDAGHDAKHEAPRSGKRTPLRVLIVGSSEDDVLLLLDELKCGGYEALYEQVQTLGEIEEALARESWDLVLADHHASLFSATGALVLLRQKEIDLPLIVVSGDIGWDVAVALMKDGARDYVSKDDLARLMPAIERELREAENRRKKKLAEKALDEAEVKYRNLFENAVEGIFQSTTDGRIRLANPALARILGYPSPEEFITSIRDVAHEIYAEPDRREEFFEQARRHGSVSGFEVRTLRKDGSVIWVSVNARVIYDEAGEIAGFEGFVEDITERKRVEEDWYENEERFRSLVQHAPDIITILESDGTIRYESPAVERVLGYQPEELIGQNAFDYVHRDDLERLASVTGEVLRDPSVPSTTEFRFRSSDGSWRLLEAVIRGLSDGNGAGEVVVNARDVTERKQAEKKLRQSEELYRNVIEQAAENIFLVDVETRRVLEANSTFHRSLGYSAEELQNLTLYDFIDHDGESIDWNAQRILKEGHAFLGERRYRRKDSSLINVEVSASAVSYGGKNVMCVVAHDVTERKRIEEDLKRSLGTLLALREAGQILGSTLESEEIASRLLEIMRGVSGLTAAVISREDERGKMRVWRAAGLERLWKRARFARKAEHARRAVLETGEHQVFWLRRQEGSKTEHLAGMCLPLRMRGRLTGVLEAYSPESLAEGDAASTLGSLAAQAASALENALLYEELAEREKRLESLIGKLFAAQEEERRRVAYEVHDGLAQVAVAAHQHLQAFDRLYPPGSEEARALLDRALGWVQQTVGEARRVIADLRPTALDDFGLQTAIRLKLEALREEGWRADYKENLGDERLPLAIETALFRVVQEALRNVRKHANTERVDLSLDRSGQRISISVKDWGRGFDTGAFPLGGPGERVGLSSMRERVVLLGGDFKIYSRPGAGTLITVDVPLPEQGEAKHERAKLG